MTGSAYVDLYWLPLGAGGRVVRWNGRLYEALAARRDRRRPQPLYHCALEVCDGAGRFVIEMAPVWSLHAEGRGVVVEGPVGSVLLGRLRAFRYEVRCWRDGVIPDVSEAVASPCRVSQSKARADALLSLLGDVPVLTWGRDELRCGDMWNSNSLVSWLLAGSGHEMTEIRPPGGGRAPGWLAGLTFADRARGPLDATRP